MMEIVNDGIKGGPSQGVLAGAKSALVIDDNNAVALSETGWLAMETDAGAKLVPSKQYGEV